MESDLTSGVWCHEALRLAVVVRGRRFDYRQDLVAIAQCGTPGFKDQRNSAFGRYVAVIISD